MVINDPLQDINNVSYSTNPNYVEQQNMMRGLANMAPRRANMANRNVRRTLLVFVCVA